MGTVIDIKTKKTLASIAKEDIESYPSNRSVQVVMQFASWWFSSDYILLGIVPSAVPGGIPTIYAQPHTGRVSNYGLFSWFMFWLIMMMPRSYKDVTFLHFFSYYKNRMQIATGCHIIFCRELPPNIRNSK